MLKKWLSASISRPVRPGRETFIGADTLITGDVEFSSALVIEGRVIGNVRATDDHSGELQVRAGAVVEGNVEVPNILIDGTVTGDVHANEYCGLQSGARVQGTVHYAGLEMAIGAEVNGNLINRADPARAPAVAPRSALSDAAPAPDAPALKD